MAAGIRRYAYLGDGKWSPNFTVMAQGLRNSVAMVRHSSGTLLQAENSEDFPPADTPVRGTECAAARAPIMAGPIAMT